MNVLLNLDASISQRFVIPRESRWRQVARVIAHLGDGPYVFGGLGLAYLFSWPGQQLYLRQATIVITLIVLAAIALVTLVKFMVRRQRPHPPGEFVTFRYDAYSFPSGHSARLAALAAGTVFFFPTLGWILLMIALSVAAARVAVGVHYVSDILTGFGIGVLVAWQVIRLLPYI